MSSTHLLLRAGHLLRGQGVDRQGSPSPPGGHVSTHEPSLTLVSATQRSTTRRPARRGWCESLGAALLGPSREARRRTSWQMEAQRVPNGSHSEGWSPRDSPLWAKEGSGPLLPGRGPREALAATGERHLQTRPAPVRGELLSPVMPAMVY